MKQTNAYLPHFSSSSVICLVPPSRAAVPVMPAIDEIMQRSDALLFGRRTWEAMAAAWPDRAGDPFADRMNAITKYVASRTLAEHDMTWSNSTLLPADDAIGAVRQLRDREGAGIQVWAAHHSPSSSSSTISLTSSSS